MEKIGETHQGIFDLSFFKLIPNICIMAPKDFKELENMMDYAVKLKSPVVIRYPRGSESDEKFKKYFYLGSKKAEILSFGNDVTIVAIGNQVSKAMKVSRSLSKLGIKAEVINVRFLKPIDKKTILSSINKTKFVVTLEDNTLIGGLGTEIKSLISDNNLKDVTIKCFGYPDVFVEHGSCDKLEEKYKLDEKSVFNYIKNRLGHNKSKNEKIK